MNAHTMKLVAARALDASLLTRLGHRIQVAAMSPFARAINYHDIAESEAAAFESQLRYYSAHFEPMGYPDLIALLNGAWRGRRPGLILSFDDGLRSHAEIVAPLLERYGFPGWFFIPVGLLGSRQNSTDHMTVEDLRLLAGRHVIGCHTISHVRLSRELSPEVLEREIVGGKRELETALGGAPVDVFCWVGGEEWSYSSEAARLVKRAGYKFSFMTNNAVIRCGDDPLQLQRTNIEARDPLWLVRFQISGVLDLMYSAKRARVNRLTA
ncbi:MAG: polysaccharide deacetylase family protein [Gemmatimonadaceae bacterium]